MTFWNMADRTSRWVRDPFCTEITSTTADSSTGTASNLSTQYSAQTQWNTRIVQIQEIPRTPRGFKRKAPSSTSSSPPSRASSPFSSETPRAGAKPTGAKPREGAKPDQAGAKPTGAKPTVREQNEASPYKRKRVDSLSSVSHLGPERTQPPGTMLTPDKEAVASIDAALTEEIFPLFGSDSTVSHRDFLLWMDEGAKQMEDILQAHTEVAPGFGALLARTESPFSFTKLRPLIKIITTGRVLHYQTRGWLNPQQPSRDQERDRLVAVLFQNLRLHAINRAYHAHTGKHHKKNEKYPAEAFLKHCLIVQETYLSLADQSTEEQQREDDEHTMPNFFLWEERAGLEPGYHYAQLLALWLEKMDQFPRVNTADALVGMLAQHLSNYRPYSDKEGSRKLSRTRKSKRASPVERLVFVSKAVEPSARDSPDDQRRDAPLLSPNSVARKLSVKFTQWVNNTAGAQGPRMQVQVYPVAGSPHRVGNISDRFSLHTRDALLAHRPFEIPSHADTLDDLMNEVIGVEAIVWEIVAAEEKPCPGNLYTYVPASSPGRLVKAKIPPGYVRRSDADPHTVAVHEAQALLHRQWVKRHCHDEAVRGPPPAADRHIPFTDSAVECVNSLPDRLRKNDVDLALQDLVNLDPVLIDLFGVRNTFDKNKRALRLQDELGPMYPLTALVLMSHVSNPHRCPLDGGGDTFELAVDYFAHEYTHCLTPWYIYQMVPDCYSNLQFLGNHIMVRVRRIALFHRAFTRVSAEFWGHCWPADDLNPIEGIFSHFWRDSPLLEEIDLYGGIRATHQDVRYAHRTLYLKWVRMLQHLAELSMFPPLVEELGVASQEALMTLPSEGQRQVFRALNKALPDIVPTLYYELAREQHFTGRVKHRTGLPDLANTAEALQQRELTARTLSRLRVMGRPGFVREDPNLQPAHGHTPAYGPATTPPTSPNTKEVKLKIREQLSRLGSLVSSSRSSDITQDEALALANDAVRRFNLRWLHAPDGLPLAAPLKGLPMDLRDVLDLRPAPEEGTPTPEPAIEAPADEATPPGDPVQPPEADNPTGPGASPPEANEPPGSDASSADWASAAEAALPLNDGTLAILDKTETGSEEADLSSLTEEDSQEPLADLPKQEALEGGDTEVSPQEDAEPAPSERGQGDPASLSKDATSPLPRSGPKRRPEDDERVGLVEEKIPRAPAGDAQLQD